MTFFIGIAAFAVTAETVEAFLLEDATGRFLTKDGVDVWGFEDPAELIADGGVFSLDSDGATLSVERFMAAESGGFTLAGGDADLDKVGGLFLIAEPNVFTLSGAEAALAVERGFTAESGAFTLTGAEAGLVYSGDVVMVAAPGAFTLGGVAAALAVDWGMIAESGSFTLSGADADLVRGMVAAPGWSVEYRVVLL